MSTSALTIDDLFQTIRECAGLDESVSLDGDVLDHSFTDLGYDSVAMLEVAGRIERRLDIKLDDEAIGEAGTPRLFLSLINESAAAIGSK